MNDDIIYDGEIHVHDDKTAYIAKKILVDDSSIIEYEKLCMLQKYSDYLVENDKNADRTYLNNCLLNCYRDYIQFGYFLSFCYNAKFKYLKKHEISPLASSDVLALEIQRCKNDNLEPKKIMSENSNYHFKLEIAKLAYKEMRTVIDKYENMGLDISFHWDECISVDEELFHRDELQKD